MRRKKIWITTEDVVLVSIREFEDGKVDILHKYDYDETKSLQSMKEIPKMEEKESERSDSTDIIVSENEEEVSFSNDIISEDEFIDTI